MARNRVPFDVARLQKKVTNCFICDFLAGSSRYPHHVVAETEETESHRPVDGPARQD